MTVFQITHHAPTAAPPVAVPTRPPIIVVTEMVRKAAKTHALVQAKLDALHPPADEVNNDIEYGWEWRRNEALHDERQAEAAAALAAVATPVTDLCQMWPDGQQPDTLVLDPEKIREAQESHEWIMLRFSNAAQNEPVLTPAEAAARSQESA